MAMDCQTDLTRSMEQMDIVDPQKLCESLQYVIRNTGMLATPLEDRGARLHSSPVTMPGMSLPERNMLDLHLPSLDSSTESSPPIQSSPACYRDHSEFRSRSVFDNCRSLPSSISFLTSFDSSLPFRERSSSLKRMRDDSCAEGQELGCSVPKRCRLINESWHEDYSAPTAEHGDTLAVL